MSDCERDPRQQIYYVDRPGERYDYNQRTQKELVTDVNTAHKFIRKIVREKDEMRDELTTTKSILRVAKLEIRILELLLGGLFLASLALLKFVKH